MNKLLLFFMFLLLGQVNLLAQDSQEALDYLNQFTEGQQDISERLMRYISVSAHSNSSGKIERKRSQLVTATKKLKDKVDNSSDFYGDASLRESMVAYYNLCYQSLTGNYKVILDLKDKANSDYLVMKELLEAEEAANKQLDDAQAELEKEVDRFAATYKINLIKSENPLSEMLIKSNEVSLYYNDIFLPMFKVNLQNVQVKEALETNDIEKIETARLATIEYAKEAEKALNERGSFYNDDALLNAARARVEYYVEEGNTMAIAAIEYSKASKQLAEAKEELDKTKPKKVTQKMVDGYNSLVNKTNRIAEEMNRNAQKFNQISQKELMQWEVILLQFRKKHIPKYGLYENAT